MGCREQQVHPRGLGAMEISFCVCVGVHVPPLHLCTSPLWGLCCTWSSTFSRGAWATEALSL